ncbi:MAG: AAC(3)-I family aminoglycoside N-acetyltransferase [Thiothrix sp.]|nr:AAC(3)-I family aminoglycoside N-acetyltransferase [Thiothrix sp.]HPE60935.1 AAC(3)-I family aminoglycoside N-acetyltransferase [Thiolinea sp.]
MPIEIRQLGPGDIELMNDLLTNFGEVFNDMNTYTGKRPGPDYIKRLLGGDSFVALVAREGREVVGGVAAYELIKFEQERSEFYIYDLAVSSAYRRKGIATALIGKLRTIAAERGAYVLFVQADTGVEDEPAIALYTKLGVREDVLHFDISVDQRDGTA